MLLWQTTDRHTLIPPPNGDDLILVMVMMVEKQKGRFRRITQFQQKTFGKRSEKAVSTS